ncbi:MAG: PhoPQ-activated pathogenicity-like protein PqaA type [Firmicutes bacterium]|nr:PhoPQ-activated pathogenicity-like protein PqaA type [Bacillota bacterium]
MGFVNKHAALILIVGLLLCPAMAGGQTRPLDEYVAAPDTVFKWQLLTSLPVASGGTLHQITFTSQTWKETVWNHRIYLVIPDGELIGNTALLFITGSGSGTTEVTLMTQLAQMVSAPVAVLFDVPNQPLFGGLREDALIAMTFDKFLETEDPTWPALVPMTKAAVRALDVITEFCRSRLDWEVKDFLVTGGSKRGWTTWLAAAVDDRISVIAPIAYDNLDLNTQMELQTKSFGSYSLKIHDYTERSLQQKLTTELGLKLVDIVDPYAYRDRYTLPKLIIRGSNDPYWPTDATLVYIDDLPGDTWIHNDPNGGHDLSNYPRVLATLAGYFISQTRGPKIGPVKWNVTESAEDFTLEVISPAPAHAFNLWSATALSRDFRNATWSHESVEGGEKHTFKIPRHSALYRAVYGEVIFKVGDLEMAFDTPIFIVEPRR